MATDARIAVGLPKHPKTKKLIKRLGQSAAWNLVCLILWVASDRSDGDLSGMSDEDIELAADWSGEDGSFVAALVDVRFIDGEQGGYYMHDWHEHNPWAAGADMRSAKARWNAAKRHHGIAEADRLVPEYAAVRNADSNASSTQAAQPQQASSNAPSPSPSPSPSPKEEKASASPKPVVVLKASDIEADGVSADHARDWLKARKVPLTLTAWAGIKREADKALISYGDVVRLMAEKGWRSFDADWLAKARGSPPRQPTAAQMAMAQACPTLVAPHLQAFTPQQTTFVEVIDDDARLLG